MALTCPNYLCCNENNVPAETDNQQEHSNVIRNVHILANKISKRIQDKHELQTVTTLDFTQAMFTMSSCVLEKVQGYVFLIRDDEHCSALMLAANTGQSSVMKVLLDNHASVNEVDKMKVSGMKQRNGYPAVELKPCNRYECQSSNIRMAYTSLLF